VAWDNILSRGIWVLIQPSNFLFMMLIIGYLFSKYAHKNSKYNKFAKKIISLSLIILCFAGFTNLSAWLLWPIEGRFEQYTNETDNGPYSGIIVLSGSEKSAISTSVNQATLNHGGERLIETAALARKLPILPIIYTGGGRAEPDELSENDVAKMFFRQAAIDFSRIKFDDKAYNTHTNATMTKKLIRPDENNKWLLITSAFHMPRSVGAFREAAINIQPYPVDYKTTLKYAGIFSIDFSKNLRNFDLVIHEYIGLLAYYITGRSSALFPGVE
jgi:uncharacterized SAM-binding protein YcdF (DUF218 family)